MKKKILHLRYYGIFRVLVQIPTITYLYLVLLAIDYIVLISMSVK